LAPGVCHKKYYRVNSSKDKKKFKNMKRTMF
jgi:hypothetical protein